MIDDFRPKGKPKRIEPLEKPDQKSIHELAAEHDAAESAASPDIPEPAFQPPDAVAEQEQESPPESDTAVMVDGAQAKKAGGFMSWKWSLSKKWTIVFAAVALIALGTAGFFAYQNFFVKDKGGSFASERGKYVSKTVASNLTGLQVDPAVNERPVTGIMIENSTDARPQSGLNQAGVVFEAIAEGGITRFLALFQDSEPDYIGPVRSARPYYVQWCMGFDCAYAHVGGSPEALADIRAWGTKDLDQFYNAGAYHRISSRYAPHNMYTSMEKLNALEASKGFGKAEYTGFKRKKDQPYKAPAANTEQTGTATAQDTRTPANAISFAISSPLYNSTFTYDKNSNSYLRGQGGAPHMTIDAAGNQSQINPKVVVALVTNYGLAADNHHSRYDVVGSGSALIFQDGTVTAASWSKADIKEPLKLVDAEGKDVALNAGRTWLTALSSAGLATYQ